MAALLLSCGDDAAGPAPTLSSPIPAEDGLAPARAPDGEAPSPVLASAPWWKIPDDWDAQHPFVSANAKPDLHFTALAERTAPQNPADGGGRAWLERVSPIDPNAEGSEWRRQPGRSDRPTVPAATLHRFEILFEVGPLGLAEGGVIFLRPEATWGWSEAQTADPNGPGYTTAKALAEGVHLEVTRDAAAFTVRDRPLEPGERISLIYGAGPAGAQVDQYAERQAEIMIATDANGDGVRKWIENGPRLDILAREPKRLLAFGPAEGNPNERIPLTIALVDGLGNPARWPQARLPVSVRALPQSEIGLTGGAAIAEAGPGRDGLSVQPEPGEGTLRLRIEGQGPISGFGIDLPPIVLRNGPERLVWTDLHGHSGLSDGTGTPEDFFDYARNVARLDGIALTDHDHWGARPIDEHPDLQNQIFRATEAAHEPGHFVTLPGFEWTSWLHGHRHVLYFDAHPESAPWLSSIDAASDRPDELWDALRGQNALSFAHHPAGEPVAMNTVYPPDPELEPVIEIASVHGSSEAADSPSVVRGAMPGGFGRDLLLRGHRLGFVGSGDSHDGHPGLSQLAAGQGGLAGLFVAGQSRADYLHALRERRTFATNGIRPWFEVDIDGTGMGGQRIASPAAGQSRTHTLRIVYEATAPVLRVDLIRGGRVATIEPEDETLRFEMERTIPALAPGDFHYVRVVQTDGGIAWSSPIFFVPDANEGNPE